MVIARDFNARTGKAQDSLSSQDLSDSLDGPIQPTSCMTLGPTSLEDKAPVCDLGKLPLKFCQGSDSGILNGRTPGRLSGCCTCHTSNGPEFGHCPLTTTLDLQAQVHHNSERVPQVQSTGSDADPLQIKYNVDKDEIFREALCNLLEPVFGNADPSFCLVTALQSWIAHAALATFGHPIKTQMPESAPKVVMQKWCRAAHAALNHVPHRTGQHKALRKAYKTVSAASNKNGRGWQQRMSVRLLTGTPTHSGRHTRNGSNGSPQHINVTWQPRGEASQALYKANNSPSEASTAQQQDAKTTTVSPIQPHSPACSLSCFTCLIF